TASAEEAACASSALSYRRPSRSGAGEVRCRDRWKHMAENHRPGLPSLNEARAERRRQLATGRARVGGLPPQLFRWGGLLLVTLVVAYSRVAQSDLEKARNELLAKQRAVAQSLGPRLLPIRDKVEAAAQELRSARYPGDLVSPNLDLEK